MIIKGKLKLWGLQYMKIIQHVWSKQTLNVWRHDYDNSHRTSSEKPQIAVSYISGTEASLWALFHLYESLDNQNNEFLVIPSVADELSWWLKSYTKISKSNMYLHLMIFIMFILCGQIFVITNFFRYIMKYRRFYLFAYWIISYLGYLHKIWPHLFTGETNLSFCLFV